MVATSAGGVVSADKVGLDGGADDADAAAVAATSAGGVVSAGKGGVVEGGGGDGGEERESEGFVARRGVCTNWLEEILTPFLLAEKNDEVSAEDGRRAVGKKTGIFVPLFVKPTKEFLLPASAKWPCVLIGPGTG